MALKFIENIKDSLSQGKEDPAKVDRFAGVNGFFNRTIGESSVSWGLLLLGAFGVYAVINIVRVVLYFFN